MPFERRQPSFTNFRYPTNYGQPIRLPGIKLSQELLREYERRDIQNSLLLSCNRGTDIWMKRNQNINSIRMEADGIVRTYVEEEI